MELAASRMRAANLPSPQGKGPGCRVFRTASPFSAGCLVARPAVAGGGQVVLRKQRGQRLTRGQGGPVRGQRRGAGAAVDQKLTSAHEETSGHCSLVSGASPSLSPLACTLVAASTSATTKMAFILLGDVIVHEPQKTLD